MVVRAEDAQAQAAALGALHALEVVLVLHRGRARAARLAGVGNNSDEFPNDPNEWSDADSDGVGDNLG